MLVLIRYTDDTGHDVRLVTDGDAWARQQYRRGGWRTMERHLVQDLETPLGVSASEETPVGAEESSA
jgi:predicted type IV restriction endonuclease